MLLGLFILDLFKCSTCRIHLENRAETLPMITVIVVGIVAKAVLEEAVVVVVTEIEA